MPTPRRLALLAVPALLLLLAALSTQNAIGSSDEDFWDRNRRALTQLAALAATGAAAWLLVSGPRRTEW